MLHHLKRFNVTVCSVAAMLWLAAAPPAFARSSEAETRFGVDPLFQEPSTLDLLLSIGTTVGAAFLAGPGNFVTNFGTAMATAQVGRAATGAAAEWFGWSPAASQIFGYAITGGIAGGLTGSHQANYRFHDSFLGEDVGGFFDENPTFGGVTMGLFKGAAIGGGSVLTYESLKGTGFYRDNPAIGQLASSIIGDAVGYLGFQTLLSLGGVDVAITVPKSYVQDGKLWETPLEDLHATEVPKAYNGDGGYQIWASDYGKAFPGPLDGLRLTFQDPDFQTFMVSETISLGVEYLASEGVIDGKVAGAFLAGAALTKLAAGNLSSGLIGNAAMLGLVNGASTVFLNDVTGELGLTPVQQALVKYAGTTVIASGYQALTGDIGFFNAIGKNVTATAAYIGTIEGTSPIATAGAGGWSEGHFIQNVAEIGGFTNFAANADFLKQATGLSWSELRERGAVWDVLLPSFGFSFVNEFTVTLTDTAESNLNTLAR